MSEHRLLSEPFDTYAKSHGVSATLLDCVRKSAAHARAYLDGRLTKKTDALSLGTLIHAMILDDSALANIAVKPAGMRLNTKAGMEWQAGQGEKEIVSTDDWNTAKSVRDAVYANKDARKLLSGGNAEQSLYVEDSHGTTRKSRFDYLNQAGSALTDLKTCRDASPDGFSRSILNYGYHMRAAFYIDNANLAGLEKEDFVFIAVENEAPHCVSVFRLDPIVIEYGRKIYRADLQRYRNAVESNTWPGYVEEISLLGLPRWEQQIAENSE